jgi:hypothetical protein
MPVASIGSLLYVSFLIPGGEATTVPMCSGEASSEVD